VCCERSFGLSTPATAHALDPAVPLHSLIQQLNKTLLLLLLLLATPLLLTLCTCSTVTAESKCLYPLKVDATFEISMDSPGPGIWKRISAAIPDDTDPDYTIYISSAARAQALSAREADPATKRESGMSAHVAAAATENDDDSSDRYGGDMRRHRERRDRDGHRYIDERRGSDEDGPADRRRGGGRGYRSYDKEEEASYEDRRGDGRGDRR
jgi:hypothetical protein